MTIQNKFAVLKNAFDTFDVEKKGSIGTVMVGTILGMLGIQITEKMLQEIIDEVDEDGTITMHKQFCECNHAHFQVLVN